MKFKFRHSDVLSKLLCLLLTVLFVTGNVVVSAAAADVSSDETLDTELSATDDSSTDDLPTGGSITGPIISDDIITDLGNGDGTVDPNAVPTDAYSNDYISIAATNIVLEPGEAYDVRYLLKQPGYTVELYFGGCRLYTASVDGSFIKLQAKFESSPTTISKCGETSLMVYYSKRNGNDIINEGHVFINIRVQPEATYAHIRNVKSGLYIGTKNGNSTANTKAELQPLGTSLELPQIWRIIPNEDGTCLLTTAFASGGNHHRYLARNVSTNYCQLSDSSISYILQSNDTDNYFLIKNASKYLSTENNGVTSGTNLKFVTNSTADDATSWSIERINNYVAPSKVTITSPTTATTMDAYVNNTINFSAAISPSTSTFKQMKWTSSNSNVITIDGNTGVAQAKSIGEADITVTTVANERKDTIKVKVVPNKLSVDVYYDEAFQSLYAQAYNDPDINNIDSIINSITTPVKQKYLNDFMIDITFVNKGVYHSLGDSCTSATITPNNENNNEENAANTCCRCVVLGKPASYHTYLPEMVNAFSPSDSTGDVQLLLTGYFTQAPFGYPMGYTPNNSTKCVVTANPGIYTNNNYLNEMSFSDSLLAPAVACTVAHEIGHLFGTPDHYNKYTSELEQNQSHDCIWGNNFKVHEIFTTLTTCTFCENTILSNNHIFND